MSKHERFVTRHDGRLVIDKLTDQVVADNRTKEGLRADWMNPNIDVRRGLDDSLPIESGSERGMWIEQHNQTMGKKDPRIKQALRSIKISKEKGLTPAQFFSSTLGKGRKGAK